MARKYQIEVAPVAVMAHLLVIAVTTLVLVWLLNFRGGLAFRSDNKHKILNLHIFFMVIGFILPAGEAIMAYHTVAARRRSQKAVHFVLHFVALVCGALGIYATVKFHHEQGLREVYTLHAWLGVVTISLFGLQWLFAFFTYVSPRAQMSVRGSYMPWHVFGGFVIFCLSICTAQLGLLEVFVSPDLSTRRLVHGQQALIVNFTGLLLFLFGVAVALTTVLPRVF